MKTVGIIGGLGPETTSKFYIQLVSACSKRGEQTHPPILIYSVPLPLQIEKECIVNGEGEEKCVPFLIQAAKTLEQGGADFLVMPCNSLHLFIEEIRKAVKIPVLSIIEETTKFLKQQNIKEVGILATSITINRGLYNTAFKTHGINEVVLDNQNQAKLGEVIYNLVTGKYTKKDSLVLDEMIRSFDGKKLGAIILACTDLQILNPYHKEIKIFDTIQILVNATVEEMIE